MHFGDSEQLTFFFFLKKTDLPKKNLFQNSSNFYNIQT